MKQKTFYILIIICCMSLFSSAKQSGKDCGNKSCCAHTKQGYTKPLQSKSTKEDDADLPPLRLLSFGL